MKLSDIIDFKQSFWHVLGKTGGTALAHIDKSKKINGVAVWKKSPPFNVGKKKKRIDEYQRGGDIDWQQEKGAEEFNPGDGSQKDDQHGGWAKDGKESHSKMSHTKRGKKKYFVKRVGKHADEVMDDEGNKFLKGTTSKITPADHLGKRYEGIDYLYKLRTMANETINSIGGGASGASTPPQSGPSELEYDLSHENVEKEFKGKDSRADIKTSKKKRERLTKYLDRKRNATNK
jgi:hypothetical protein